MLIEFALTENCMREMHLALIRVSQKWLLLF